MYDEDALLEALGDVIKKHANYTDVNVSIGSQRALDGGVDTAVVIEAGSLTSEEDEENRYFMGTVSIYNAVAYIYRRYTYDDETRKNLRSDVKNVRTIVDGYHRLDGNAESCKLVTATEPLYVGDREGGGPYFMLRRTIVRIKKIEDLDTLE
jgi:hypothetical protein